VLGCDRFSVSPYWCDLDFVDAIAPGVPLSEFGFVQSIRELELIEFAAGKLAHFD
jgi:hypothetical protein